MEQGHPLARRYPIGMLMEETQIVTRRINNRIATEAALVQMAVSGVLSKKANDAFRKTMKQLTS